MDRDITLTRQRDDTWLLEIPDVRLTRLDHPDNPRYIATLERDELFPRLVEGVAAPLRARIAELESLAAEILGTLNASSCEGLHPARIHPQQLAEWRTRAGLDA